MKINLFFVFLFELLHFVAAYSCEGDESAAIEAMNVLQVPYEKYNTDPVCAFDNSTVVELSDKTWDHVIESGKWFVQLTAEGCANCTLGELLFNDLSHAFHEKYPDVHFARVYLSSSLELSVRLLISRIPSYYFIDNQNFYRVSPQVLPKNKAIALYEKDGFKSMKKEQGFFSVNGPLKSFYWVFGKALALYGHLSQKYTPLGMNVAIFGISAYIMYRSSKKAKQKQAAAAAAAAAKKK
ncbi:Thioredoxin family protein [Schizosaccharomyces pombe]|uniref:Uncharacterized protein C777.12c n=1 Tax=Schizosaccharomyces pombe (strain 972 / ATCC 24843) TaxID=284812 RepID=YCVC_SCHPO|nr:thioredoxin family protein [Schizosaccharomyces pombe]O74551.1 RecName: Full=Uncharacterized protein C777.12c; Flags: Precursor [Schizosaccharomyces pombe 972h-]CAA20716.1 thioredoxin family protein [Schizosaccharomyces pombe]|eukprot:NP_588258.1 thioredoxin family protein [Schizosaccharomyces pombe]